MLSGFPVVIAANGRGAPVTQVLGKAPAATVATNGYGAPIVLVADGGVPLVLFNPDGTPYTGGGGGHTGFDDWMWHTGQRGDGYVQYMRPWDSQAPWMWSTGRRASGYVQYDQPWDSVGPWMWASGRRASGYVQYAESF